MSDLVWIEGDALKTFFALGGTIDVGDKIALDPEKINKEDTDHMVVLGQVGVVKDILNRAERNILVVQFPGRKVMTYPMRVLRLLKEPV